MYTPVMELGERAYEPAHIEKVLAAIRKHFPRYWESFVGTAREKFREAVATWENEHTDYVNFLAPECLAEYEDDPNAFKGALRSKCPIVRRSLNSPSEEMKKYKKAFNRAEGRHLLTTTLNIVAFREQHMEGFDDVGHARVKTVDDLGLADLRQEDYVVYGVIGGGIRSHFLYSLNPNAFPNRSRPAVWALYFLSGKDDFGFEDGSEFLMIEVEKSSTQQNYQYPYDLFAFYALQVYGMIQKACAAAKIPLRLERRYVYLDAFVNFVHDKHQEEVNLLKGSPEDVYGD
jgi:hypothetical protein